MAQRDHAGHVMGPAGPGPHEMPPRGRWRRGAGKRALQGAAVTRLLQPGADMDVSATVTLPLRPGADMDMVSVSTKDTAAWFWVPSRTLKIAAAPTRCDGWQSQLFSPAHPLRLRMEEVRVEALVGGRKPVVGSREAVNRVGAPRTVQEGESVGPQRVVVLLTLRRVRKVVGAHIPRPYTGPPRFELDWDVGTRRFGAKDYFHSFRHTECTPEGPAGPRTPKRNSRVMELGTLQ